VQLDAPVGADNFGLDRCSAATTQRRSPLARRGAQWVRTNDT
jgi:hypothetical protein